MTDEHTSDEKILAGMAHLLGLILALVIWACKKGDSHYVSFHALQAAMFDGLVSLVGAFLISLQLIVSIILSVGVWVGTNLIADLIAPETPIIYFVLSLIFLLCLLGGMGFIIFFILVLKLVDLIAAISVFCDKAWRYPLFAQWAEKLSQRGLSRS